MMKGMIMPQMLITPIIYFIKGAIVENDNELIKVKKTIWVASIVNFLNIHIANVKTACVVRSRRADSNDMFEFTVQ